MNKNKTQKGITLIALIITIIIMLILVAVTVTIAINGGLFGMAKDAKSKTENELAKENALSTGRVEIDNVWYDSMEDYIKGNKSANQGDGQEVVERPETVAGLKAGQYVNYVYEKEDGTQETIPCIVLYDEAYNTEHGTNYGIQIITADVVEQVELGEDFHVDMAENEDISKWENIVYGLDDILLQHAKKYLNEDIASMARCAGSSPDGRDAGVEELEYYYDEDYGTYIVPGVENDKVPDYIQIKQFVPPSSISCDFWMSYPWSCSKGATDEGTVVGLCKFYSESLNLGKVSFGEGVRCWTYRL